MSEAILENSLELTNHLVDRHFEDGWDKYRKYVNGKKVEETYHPYRKADDHASSDSSSSFGRPRERTPTAVRSSAPATGGSARNIPLTGTVAGAAALTTPYPGSRRKQRNQLPSPQRDIDHPDFRRDSIGNLRQECETNDRVLREYELETDDPKRHPESILSLRDLRKLQQQQQQQDPRRDSAMASGYNDSYSQAPYSSEASRPRSQPPRSRYYDDDDSDYDERSGRRFGPRNGRGYDDDRDYDRIVEETERYRGPVSSGPLVVRRQPQCAVPKHLADPKQPVSQRPSEYRRESFRSGTEGPYGAGAVTQYGRRSDGALDRQTDAYVSRRSQSRGRDDRDRSYSRSRSRSRSRSKDGIRGQIENAFDTSGRGLGVGLAGAVIGGLAGRQFGHKHRERDIILGAVIGGLGANVAENQYTRWKDNKERDLREDEQRWENKWEGRNEYGRSRSNVR